MANLDGSKSYRGSTCTLHAVCHTPYITKTSTQTACKLFEIWNMQPGGCICPYIPTWNIHRCQQKPLIPSELENISQESLAKMLKRLRVILWLLPDRDASDIDCDRLNLPAGCHERHRSPNKTTCRTSPHDTAPKL